MVRERSYTAATTKIQSIRTVAVALALVTAGCSQVSVPLGSADVQSPVVLTGAIPSPTDIAYTDVSPEDRQVISASLDTLARSDPMMADLPDGGLPWTNPESGNSGTISRLRGTQLADTGCIGFTTTANTIAGIKLYSGTACKDVSTRFAVTALTVTDA